MIKKFFAFIYKKRNFFFEEIVKAIFLVIIAITSFTLWEKKKVYNEASFSKKLEILSQERMLILENANKFSENWGEIIDNSQDSIVKDCQQSGTYKKNYYSEQQIIARTDMILSNNLINSDEIKLLQKELSSLANELLDDMDTCKLNQEKYSRVSSTFDKIINLYSKEIIKHLK